MDSKTRAELIQYVDRQLDYVNVQLKLSPDSIQERAVAIVDHIVAAMQPSETDADLTLAYLAGVERGGDLDALLDSVHPNAVLNSMYALRAGGWEVRLSIPEGPDEDGWYSYLARQYKGTGETRAAAIKDAIRKAKEAQQ